MWVDATIWTNGEEVLWLCKAKVWYKTFKMQGSDEVSILSFHHLIVHYRRR